ncbi:acyl-[acyl-carrier-protein] thioesterase [Paenibacillus pinistramenti]|uniref:acyl-[acyl-carrier-protein] thioesterase n=1 Tax=Paenibacillus pinistramenti TaxID=1768003 RepID=UPI001EEFA38C|nr:acyl-ACP thioesterase domain-containing protein [Paenibacillus pinistramenti]
MDNKALVWSEERLIFTSDADYRANCRLSVLLDYLQQAADSAVNALGISWQELLAGGMGWMLMTLDLDIDQHPRFGDKVTISTWSKGTKGPVWQRDYRLKGQNGEQAAAARSTWTLVDIHKRKILRPSALPVEVPPYTEDSVGAMPEKVSIPETIRLEEALAFELKYSSVDINGHVNNARYADFCYDTLTQEELAELELRRFHITYIKETKMGDRLRICRSSLAEGRIYIRGYAGDEAGTVCFEACLYFA